MKIKQTRIRALTKILSDVDKNENFILGVELTTDIERYWKKSLILMN